MILMGKWRFIDKRSYLVDASVTMCPGSRMRLSLLLSTHNKWAGLRLKTSGTVQTFSGPDDSVSTVSISIQILKIFDILTSGWSLSLTIYTPLRCLGWKVKFWRWMAKIKMNVTFLNEILFWMNGTELVLRICTSYSWPVTILQMICTAPSISDNSQQSTRKYKILCPHIKSTSPNNTATYFTVHPPPRQSN